MSKKQDYVYYWRFICPPCLFFIAFCIYHESIIWCSLGSGLIAVSINEIANYINKSSQKDT